MNTYTRNFDFPVRPDSKIPAYDSETGVIQDMTALRDLASYRRYLVMRNRSACTGNGRRQTGAHAGQVPANGGSSTSRG